MQHRTAYPEPNHLRFNRTSQTPGEWQRSPALMTPWWKILGGILAGFILLAGIVMVAV
jgi:hypothetical protein